jgi:NAD-dependent deacetylase
MNPVDHAAELLRGAHYAVALTGAGLSTPSGIPDFRSPGSGMWERVDPFEVASIFAFRRKPEAFFEWIRSLARRMVEAQPNPAHVALAQLEQAGLLRAIITQNIDGLLHRAGCQSVYEVHGHLREATCIRCYRVFATDSFIERFLADGRVPMCPVCGNVLKPNVILFGEQLPALVMQEALRHIRQCDVLLIAGSSLEVAPVSELPRVAHEHGARLILVNLQPTHMDEQADVVMHDDVAEILPHIAQACGLSPHGKD